MVAARLFWRASITRLPGSAADRVLLLGSAIFGALLGSKLLHVFEHLSFLTAHNQAALWLGGKSVLGGFLGGTLATECAKRLIDWRAPTGDAWVPAMAAGLIIGRIGCQLAGTWDQTYGIPTALAFFATRAALIASSPGASFALFMALYCVIRFALECLKPPFGAAAADALPVDLFAGLTAIQWAALIGLVWFAALLKKRLQPATPRP